MFTPPPTWADVAWLREQWGSDLPFCVKGITRVDDAKRAVDAGATAIQVSNHGGNNLDSTPAPIRVLPGIVEAVGRDVEVIMDGGVRRGSRRGEGARARRQGRRDRPRLPVGPRRRTARRASATSSTSSRAGLDSGCSGSGRPRCRSSSPEDLLIPPTFTRQATIS